MHTYRPTLTAHQRQRILLWALAMLSWIAAVLFSGAMPSLRQLRQRRNVTLGRLKRMTVQLLIIRAGELTRWPMRRRRRHYVRRGRDIRRSHLFRRMLGAKLRRVFKARTTRARIAALTHILRNLESYARLVARRLTRGLRRLWPILAARTPAAPLTEAPSLCLLAPDSS